MRISLALWPDRDVHELGDIAVAAEEAGFDDVWWPDHYDARECSAVLAVCGLRTERIRLGTAVTSVMLRHPAILASMFATLGEVTRGRVLAGVGPGGFDVRTNLRTIPEKPLGVVREAVGILRKLLAGETVTDVDARNFPMWNGRLRFRPPAEVPIYLAGRGLRMLELAGEVADGVITHGLARSYLDVARERVSAGEARAGREPGSCDLTLMFEVALDADVARARDRLRPRSLLMGGGQYPEELIPLYGLERESVLRLKEAVRSGDPKAVEMVDDRIVDAFSVGGPPERVVEVMAEHAAAGITSFILSPGEGVDADGIAELGKIARAAAP